MDAAVGRGSGLGSSSRTRSNGSRASCERPPETQCAGARCPIVPTERTGFDDVTCSTYTTSGPSSTVSCTVSPVSSRSASIAGSASRRTSKLVCTPVASSRQRGPRR